MPKIIDLEAGECLQVRHAGEEFYFKLERKSGRKSRLILAAGQEFTFTRMSREEVWDAVRTAKERGIVVERVITRSLREAGV